MALALDASTPAISTTSFVGTQTGSWASNSFSPPASSVITVEVQATSNATTWTTPTMTDSLGSHLTWNLAASQPGSTVDGGVWLFWASCPSAQTGMTVTASVGVGSGSIIGGISVKPKVWTGAKSSGPIGTVVKAEATTTTSIAPSVSPTGSNSAINLIACVTSPGSASTAGTNTYIDDHFFSSGNVDFVSAWYGTSSGPTLVSTSTTPALTTAVATTEYIAYEVLAAVMSVPLRPTLVRQAVMRSAVF